MQAICAIYNTWIYGTHILKTVKALPLLCIFLCILIVIICFQKFYLTKLLFRDNLYKFSFSWHILKLRLPGCLSVTWLLIVNHHTLWSTQSATPYLIARNDLYEFDTVDLLRGLYIQSFQDFFSFGDTVEVLDWRLEQWK